MNAVREVLQAAYSGARPATDADVEAAFLMLLDQLESGAVRAAECDADGHWHANVWVKEGILVGFRIGRSVEFPAAGPLRFFDKHNLPPRALRLEDGVRVVPGGTAVRRGAHIAANVIVMPPAYINIGASIGAGSMVDSHALVGSCAQIGARVHLSAAAQIGGVLEPPGARPVIVEDDVLVGGNCGVYEGTLVRQRAVLGAGVVLTASTPVYDVVNERILRAAPDSGLEIPAGAVVVPGTRPLRGSFASTHGLALATPLIVKYRDAATDARTALESALR